MGREAATYEVGLTAEAAAELMRRLDAAGCEQLGAGGERIDFVLRDPNRYWIDLRLHHASDRRLEIRIALTNDAWSVRAPLESVLMPLPASIEGARIHDDEGDEVAIAGVEGWSLALEDHFCRRRDEFVARVGDFTAPISADHVYMYLHQTRWNIDNDNELAWHREREIAAMEEMWERGSQGTGDDDGPEPEAEEPVR
ncbi:MAG: hypothetical protein ACR2LK_04365 [Solirubrobacteraceae bacterium]